MVDDVWMSGIDDDGVVDDSDEVMVEDENDDEDDMMEVDEIASELMPIKK